MLLLDHDGPVDRRDAIGLGLGLLAVMSSGIGVSMVVVAGITALLRRGWRVALLHTAPLAAAYLVWWSIERPPTVGNPPPASTFEVVREVVSFAATGVAGTFGALASVPYLGFLLAAVTVGGLVLAWRHLGWSDWRRQGATVAALLVGLVVFYAISGSGRWWDGSDYARTSRYLYLGAAFVLPAVAVAADALMRAVASGRAGGRGAARGRPRGQRPHAEGLDRRRRGAVSAQPGPRSSTWPIDRSPTRSIPAPSPIRGPTRGSRLAGCDRPGPPARSRIRRALSSDEEVLLPVRLGFVQRFAPPPSDCATLNGKLDVRPAKGTIYGIAGPGDRLTVTPIDDDGVATAPPVKFDANHGRRFVVQLDGLHLQLKPGFAGQPITFCEAPP